MDGTTSKSDGNSRNNTRKGKTESHLSPEQLTNYSYITSGAIVASFLLIHLILPRIPQPVSYHDFADKRKVLGIPFFFNVISNIPFLFVGLQGMNLLKSSDFKEKIDETERKLYNSFFVFVFFGGFGSAFYHLIPNHFTLLFDRLPLGAAGMALLSAVIADRISKPLGHKTLFPFLLFAALTAFYWEFTEMLGNGDVKGYAFAQFLPAVLIPIILLKMPKTYSGTHYLWNLILFFGIARIGEVADGIFYMFTFHLISGHTIKHLSLSWGVYNVYQYLKHRKPQSSHNE